MSFWGFLRWIFEGKEQSYQIKDAANFSHNITTNNNPVITWDNGSHTVQNPNNYSYSVESDYSGATGFSIVRYNCLSGTCPAFFERLNACTTIPVLGLSFTGTTGTRGGSIPTPFYIPDGDNCENAIYNTQPSSRHKYYVSMNGNNFDGYFGFTWSNTSCSPTFQLISIEEVIQSGTVNRQLIVIDGGIEYSYSIGDINSITESNEPSYTLNINDGGENLSFPIDDPNSVYPEERTDCPKDTITCDCNGLRCCYKKYNSYYKLIKTIKL